MNTKLLEACIQALRESKNPEAFFMRLYKWPFDAPLWLHAANKKVKEEWCGSPACVLGHLAARTDLQNVLHFVGDNMMYAQKDVNPDVTQEEQPLYAGENKGDVSAYFSDILLADIFGLNPDQMTALFGSNGCDGANTSQEAIDYIERFIACNGRPQKTSNH